MSNMAKTVMSISKKGISVNYVCKSIYAKNKGKKCEQIGTDACMKCDLCQAEMSAYDATRLLESYKQ